MGCSLLPSGVKPAVTSVCLVTGGMFLRAGAGGGGYIYNSPRKVKETKASCGFSSSAFPRLTLECPHDLCSRFPLDGDVSPTATVA